MSVTTTRDPNDLGRAFGPATISKSLIMFPKFLGVNPSRIIAKLGLSLTLTTVINYSVCSNDSTIEFIIILPSYNLPLLPKSKAITKAITSRVKFSP